jgi:hypothetical protein
MNITERYAEGHASGFTMISYACPPWAKSLGWNGSGLWCTIQLTDLKTAVPALKISPYHTDKAVMTVSTPPNNAFHLSQFFEMLENESFPVIASADACFLVCYGATLVRTSSGVIELVGKFQLEGSFLKPEYKILATLPPRLMLTGVPGYAELPMGVTGVAYFKVKATLTMDSDLVPNFLELEDDSSLQVTDKTNLSDGVFLKNSHNTTLVTKQRKSMTERFFGLTTAISKAKTFS